MMPTWIKLCGLSTEADIEAAVDFGAQAVGFVFARSPRAIAPALAGRLAARLPGSVASVAVMLRPTQADVDEVLQAFMPNMLQADWQSTSRLLLPKSVRVLSVHREGDGVSLDDLPARFVYEGPLSGHGQTVDWQAAKPIAQRREMVLAGGLNPGNVADAVKTVRPFGVDVSSGIEQKRGVKDAQRMLDFVQQVRVADSELARLSAQKGAVKT